MTMTKTTAVIASALALALSAASYADGHRGKNLERMQERLGLSDAQVEEMREIRANGGSREDVRAVLTDEQRSQAQQWREENPDKARKMKLRQQHAQRMHDELNLTDAQVEQMREIRENGGSRDDVNEVLTDEQREQMATWRANRPKRDSNDDSLSF